LKYCSDVSSYDLARLSEQGLLRRVNEKLQHYEELRLIYDTRFVRKLVKGYRTSNWLLWALCSRGRLLDNFWRKVVNDLRMLAGECE